MRVIVADDSKTMRRIIVNVLKEIGIIKTNIGEANDGKEGFEIFKKDKWDIILTDWNMPNMNGLQFVQEVRKINKDIPIVMITTEGGKTEVVTALKNGVNNYIVKPFNAKTLKDKLKPLIQI